MKTESQIKHFTSQEWWSKKHLIENDGQSNNLVGANFCMFWANNISVIIVNWTCDDILVYEEEIFPQSYILPWEAMDPDLYDEFGNYIGPELESESEDSSEEEREEEEEPKDDGMDQDEEEEGGQSMAIVLHEV